MNQLKSFNNPEFGNIEILVENGKELFPATEVAKMLGYKNPQEAIRVHCKGVREILTPTAGGEQEMNFIPEGDLYRLITKSKLPAAEKFERWVFDEVLPAIRKAGSYSSQPTTPTQALLQTVQLLAEQEQKIGEIAKSQQVHQQKLEILGHRIDNLDGIDVIGNMRQRLNLMIKKYAHEGGFTFSKAWNDFIQSYNMAYRTNLVLLKTHYLMKTGRKNISTPEYLSATEKLEDAVRVADKMLNKAS